MNYTYHEDNIIAEALKEERTVNGYSTAQLATIIKRSEKDIIDWEDGKFYTLYPSDLNNLMKLYGYSSLDEWFNKYEAKN